jgi:hypothetical protein
MPAPHKNPDHKKIVASLAAEFKAPIDEVATLYEREQAELSAGAKVTTFLHVFATRHVQEILRQRKPRRTSIDAG